MAFTKAKRKATPLKLALQGVSFSGKTMSAIKLAKGLANGKPVCVIDTENGSASLYDQLDFLHAVVEPPFSPDKYIALIHQAVEAEAGAIVIDSLSHAWQFILDFKEQLDTAKGRADWGHWAQAKPLWTTLKDTILQCPAHVVCTFREKAEYAIDSNDDGRGNRKNQVRKLGTKAIAEEGSEYEFTTVWKLDRETHVARVEKDRTGLFNNRHFVMNENVGRELVQWLGSPTEFDIDPAWILLQGGVPDEFRNALEQSNQARRDQVTNICARRQLKKHVVDEIKRVASERNEDWMQLIIDSERYGATTADAIIRYCALHLGVDPVRWDSMQQLSKEQAAQLRGGAPVQAQVATPVVEQREYSGTAGYDDHGTVETSPAPKPVGVATEEAKAAPVEAKPAKPDSAFGVLLRRPRQEQTFMREPTPAQIKLCRQAYEKLGIQDGETMDDLTSFFKRTFGEESTTQGFYGTLLTFLNDATPEQFDLAFAAFERENSSQQPSLVD